VISDAIGSGEIFLSPSVYAVLNFIQQLVISKFCRHCALVH